MLRCTLSSLIPLLNSEKYAFMQDELYERHESAFSHILERESYYILRELPKTVLEKFFTGFIPQLLDKQHRSGTWKIKNGERISFDVLSALDRCGRLPDPETELKYDLYKNIEHKSDLYSVIIKHAYYRHKNADIETERQAWIKKILGSREVDGSWHSTVIGTVANIETLLLLGENEKRTEIAEAVDFLFSNLNEVQEGDHVGKPYGFTAKYMFSGKDRNREFEIANRLKPEWIPRNICYRHLGVIQNSVCLNLLLKLGYENNSSVVPALDNLVQIEKTWGGFCDTDIKKAYLAGSAGT